MKSYAQATSLTIKNDFAILQPIDVVAAISRLPDEEGGTSY